MRARRSWPRSSVPKGWFQEGPWSVAAKSMWLIGMRQTYGPIRMASTMRPSTPVLMTASRCRRKRRHASRVGENVGARVVAGAATSAEGDARVEPAIEDIGNQVEEDDETGEHERHGHD